MVQLAEIKKARKEKLDLLKKSGINPYPLETKRTYLVSRALKDFSKLEKSKKEVIIAGRLRSFRIHGGASFAEVEDGTEKIQIFFKKDHLGPKRYEWFLKYLDIGDFIEARGELFKTKRKEKTLLITDAKILAKSMLPLPEKWHGLKDVEERFRKRYLDLIMNKEAKEKFLIRFQIIQELRNFLISNDFLETETPILQTIYGGAKAEPFKTHFNALDLDVYLRIATEIHLKELIVGGFERVFEIGRIFRNEGIDKHHNPEFTSLEFYWAYADYKDLMKFCEQMIAFILKKVFGKLEIEYEGEKINFKGPFKRVEFYELLRKDADIDLENIHSDKLAEKAKKMGIKIEPGEGTAEIADRIYKKYSRDKIIQPTFIIHYPVGAFPLAKPHPTLEGRLANFQLVAGGVELVNAFSELNDPIEQREIFKEQEKMYKQGYKEAQRTDENFLQALEHGMPPTAGFGMGLDRLVALLTDSHSLREVILFPTMRPKN
ncbi:lysine--tRNA ligase [Patescibacteria group bacterium]|nr:lysine--tRNA ligase [Patescibacteria group bacterium]MBU4022902.1 lysine--tRNA ligase [Patescibacteria group bacterium]MBU4078401.1 lysine--tRNA ligase [Patescibacteria group bacterium]